ncbi:NlpC/P60 family protein [Arthrobacter zhaoxinii]|uniref:NlpC/P60 family protein n=1 Tax=Arthrobacter zhaoxinii TaxID=2964616 RepID=UPI002107600C|nr:NlpC/P60 family protein [Arthrobacter zhaoxinii]MCQ2001381.1 C40 family peptidase [Arthrobacter zhaoxinii]
MSSITHGRRRAATVQTNPIAALSKAVSSNAGTVGRQAAVVVAASGLVLAAGLPAQASVSTDRQALAATPLNIVTGSVTAPANAPFELPLVAPSSTSGAEYRAQLAAEEAAAKAAEEAAAAQAAAVQAAAAQTAAAQTAARTAPAASAPTALAATSGYEAPAKPAAAQAPSNVASALVASAYGQIGVAQDCTAMVEKALRSVGKSVGDLAPGQFFQYGSVVSSPAPGDLVITGGHVAIYIGNGQVISGGLNGMNTGLHSLSDLPGASFVRVS